jgi:ferredoxin
MAVVADPYSCMVGCSTCGTVCPSGAISFPSADLIHRIEREHRVIKVARQESREKKSRMDAMRVRAAAEEAVARITERVHVEVAGEFGEKRFLARLEELLAGRPYDVIELNLRVPTVKGAAEHTPSFMSFDVVSTQQEDVSDFVAEVRQLVRDSELVLVSESSTR